MDIVSRTETSERYVKTVSVALCSSIENLVNGYVALKLPRPVCSEQVYGDMSAVCEQGRLKSCQPLLTRLNGPS